MKTEKEKNNTINGEEEQQETFSEKSETTDKKQDTDTNDNLAEAQNETADNDSQQTETDKDPLETALQENENLKDQYLRKVAEFENYRKRTLKEKTELILNGAEKTVDAILPVVDDMERAMASADTTDDIDSIREGFDLIFKKLIKSLESLGVKKIETDNKDFDTDYHEAVAMVPGVGDDKKGKVIDCIQTGYTLNDKVIRHAKVAVGQ